jgi:hypothetical protein
MSDQSQNLWQVIAGMGGLSAITGLLGWLSGRRGQEANARKSEAEARKTSIEADIAEDARGNDFERVLNDRAQTVIDSLIKQVQILNDHMSTQEQQIISLRNEVRDLRIALDRTSRELHLAKYGSNDEVTGSDAFAL